MLNKSCCRVWFLWALIATCAASTRETRTSKRTSTTTTTPKPDDIAIEDPLSRPEVTVYGFWEDFGEFHEDIPEEVEDAVTGNVTKTSPPTDVVDALLSNVLHHIPDTLTLLDLPPVYDNVTLYGLDGIHRIGNAARSPTSTDVIVGSLTLPIMHVRGRWMQSSYHGFLDGDFTNVRFKMVVQLSPTPHVVAIHGSCDRSAITPSYESAAPANFWVKRSMAIGPVYQLKVLIFQALEKILLKAANSPIDED